MSDFLPASLRWSPATLTSSLHSLLFPGCARPVPTSGPWPCSSSPWNALPSSFHDWLLLMCLVSAPMSLLQCSPWQFEPPHSVLIFCRVLIAFLCFISLLTCLYILSSPPKSKLHESRDFFLSCSPLSPKTQASSKRLLMLNNVCKENEARSAPSKLTKCLSFPPPALSLALSFYLFMDGFSLCLHFSPLPRDIFLDSFLILCLSYRELKTPY